MVDVEDQIHQMVLDSRVVYDAAMDAVFGGGKSKEAKNVVKGTDAGINTAQQEVRRALLIHSSVAPHADTGRVLSFMSVVKDVERIGDYAKNIYDLAKYGVDFQTASDTATLAAYRDAVGQLITDAAAAFDSGDTAAAENLISKANDFLDEYDDRVKENYRSEGPASDAVARALYYRFLKRITAHVMNFLTALVMPLDHLDYYDEPHMEEE
jgi:phosphate uptake regulator